MARVSASRTGSTAADSPAKPPSPPSETNEVYLLDIPSGTKIRRKLNLTELAGLVENLIFLSSYRVELQLNFLPCYSKTAKFN